MRIETVDYVEGGAIGLATGAGILAWLGVVPPWLALAGLGLLAAVVVAETLAAERGDRS